ncbi:uncharacterized protein [Ptychodera flava]|uniref:uncharacterized protein n=1 Tax=Ptychodera flava TaxID=63121 RepID=UPI00396A99C3
MAFLHEHSCKCTKSELDLFTVPPTQTSVEEGQWEEVHSLTHIMESGPIEFVISGSGEDYIDLSSTLLKIKAKVTKADGTNIGADAAVGPVNLCLHSLFSQVDVHLNGKNDIQPLSYLPLPNDVGDLVNYGEEAKVTHIGSALFFKDYHLKMDEVDPTKAGGEVNKGLKKPICLHIWQSSCRYDNDAFNGSYKKNPFNLKHYDMTSLVVNVSEKQVPSKPLKLDFTKAGSQSFIMAYYSLFTGMNKIGLDEGININRYEYENGYTLFAFDLTVDLSADGGHLNLVKEGNLGIELQFRQALPNTVNLLVYGELDNVIEIDRDRNVLFDF